MHQIEPAAAAVPNRYPGYAADYQGIGLRQLAAERKWALGLQVFLVNSV